MNARAGRSLKKPSTRSPRTSSRSPTHIDRGIAKNIVLIRNAREMSQETMAAKLGVSFQQIQKYEQVKNRISASRLYQLAQLLNVSLEDFFSGLPSASSSFSEDYLTVENIEILSLVHQLPGGDRKNIAKNLLRALRT